MIKSKVILLIYLISVSTSLSSVELRDALVTFNAANALLYFVDTILTILSRNFLQLWATNDS